MTKTLTCAAIILFYSITSFSQATLFGKVSNRETKAPIEAANVFIAHSTKGTITNSQGLFLLENLERGQVKIVVSFIGFETITKEFEIEEEKQYELNFEMGASSIDLAEIQVTAVKDKKRKRLMKKFTTNFLGFSKNANKCTIVNPEVVLLKENNNGTVEAYAEDLIEIRNEATGYHISFLLEHFELKKNQLVSYSGKPLFKELNFEDAGEFEKWEKNREKTYRGSQKHFFKALIANNLSNQGFQLAKASLANQSDFIDIGPTTRRNILETNEETQESVLGFNGFLKVVYTKEKDEITQKMEVQGLAVTNLGQPAEKDLITQSQRELNNNNGRMQISYLFSKKAKLKLRADGYPMEPEMIKEYGYWGYEGVADLLPFEYLPIEEKKRETKRNEVVVEHPKKNGFELSSLLVRNEYIKAGGPPKDGIPAINNPKFVRSATAREFLTDDDLVLGVIVNGIGKAYPIKIMNYHEIVNDVFGDLPIVVTYCPLCKSGMAFNAEVNGQKRTFGVSGLLFNSDVLLYDKETNSLWSQIMARAVSGKESGRELKMVPAVLTTFKKWRRIQPGSKILSIDTGFDKDYDKPAYTDYEKTDDLMFDVIRTSDNLPNKEMIIGIQKGLKSRAYPYSELRKTDGILDDNFEGRAIQVHYDKASESAWITDKKGEKLVATSMYWFAWYAFHPETEVFWIDKRP